MNSFIVYGIFLLTLKINSEQIKVKLKHGNLVGSKEATIFENKMFYAFYGVPYAKAPVREYRFKDPKATEAWKIVFDAREKFNGACAQPHIIHKNDLYGVEDCLYLNIYTPTLPNGNVELKTVIVWFHGYGFTSSFSHIFGADFFIDNDVVFVSVTYRIGPFGFLKTEDNFAKGNMGLKDINMALKWIRSNIKSFGGDRKKITVMGFDSGGTLLTLLLLKSSQPLFSKMILHSSSLYSPSIFQGSPLIESNRLRNYLVKKYKKEFNMSSSWEIIESSKKIYDAKEIINFQRPVVQFTPSMSLKSKIKIDLNISLPILIGYNSQESISDVIPFLNNALILKSFQNNFKFMVPFANGCSHNYTSKTYIKIGQEIKNYYFGGKIDEMSLNHFIKYVTDLHIYPTYHFIKKLANSNKGPLFVYKFNYRGQLNSVMRTSTQGITTNIKGAAKGDELCYLLRCEPFRETYMSIHRNKTDSQDRKHIKLLTELWSNFAKKDNPTPDSKLNYTWNKFTKTNNKLLLIGKEQRMITPKKEELMYKFWNHIYEQYYDKKHCAYQSHDEL